MVVRWGRIIECDSQETAGWSQESSELYDRRLDNYIIAQYYSVTGRKALVDSVLFDKLTKVAAARRGR